MVTKTKAATKFQDTGRLKASSRRTPPAFADGGYRVGRVDRSGKIIGATEETYSLEEAEAMVEGSSLVIFAPHSGITKFIDIGVKAYYRLNKYRSDAHDRKWQYEKNKVFATGPVDLWIVVNDFDQSIFYIVTDEQYAGWLAELGTGGKSVYRVTIKLPKQQTRPVPRTVKPVRAAK